MHFLIILENLICTFPEKLGNEQKALDSFQNNLNNSNRNNNNFILSVTTNITYTNSNNSNEDSMCYFCERKEGT